MANQDKLSQWIRAKAKAAGFDACHITTASLPPLIADRLKGFVQSSYHGEMSWLADSQDRRASPDAMWQEARSAIILGLNYGPDQDPMDNLAKTSHGNISVYARGRDYHEVIKGKLKQLAGQLAAHADADVKVFVDTAPLLEKPLAEQAGLGWQGKHTNLVSREFGSWLFLGTILTTAFLKPDMKEPDHCGSCTACLDICPTKAFPAPYQLDARRCISYMTIEQKSQIAPEFRKSIGNRIFGCDDCLAVCPWNKFARVAKATEFDVRNGLDDARLVDLFSWTESEFRDRHSGSSILRIGYHRWLRNIADALGNAASRKEKYKYRSEKNNSEIKRKAIQLLRKRISDSNPLVSIHASWALSKYESRI